MRWSEPGRGPGSARGIGALGAAALIVAGFGLLAPASAVSGEPPSRPLVATGFPASVRFEAAIHTGRRFDAAGAIEATKTVTLVRPSSASAAARAAIPGRGIQLQISNGLWAGYWIPETTVSYIRGMTGEQTLAAPAPVRFQPGTYLGYRFNASWNLASTRRATVTHVSTARTQQSAVINGRSYVLVSNGTWAGYWMPGTGGAPAPVPCRAGPRPTDGRAQVLRSVPTAAERIALTFDGGGRLVPARSILNLLVLERVCATIFPTGAMAASAEGRSVLQVVRDHPELFEVGNHTQHHCDLVRGGGGSGCPTGAPSSSFIAAELKTAAVPIRSAAAQSPVPYWRPPYGAVNSRVAQAAAAAGYPKTIMWNVDTIDWRPVADGGPTAMTIASKIRAAGTGSIVLLHLGGYNTLDALPWALAGLRAQGLLPTSISELRE